MSDSAPPVLNQIGTCPPLWLPSRKVGGMTSIQFISENKSYILNVTSVEAPNSGEAEERMIINECLWLRNWSKFLPFNIFPSPSIIWFDNKNMSSARKTQVKLEIKARSLPCSWLAKVLDETSRHTSWQEQKQRLSQGEREQESEQHGKVKSQMFHKALEEWSPYKHP